MPCISICAKDPESAALHKGLVVEPRDILLEKPRFGAFHGTDLDIILPTRGIDLDMILPTRGIDTVIITGIATNVCYETTVREAMVRDFRVFFLSDGTTTFGMGNASGAELHKATLATLGSVFAQVLTVDELMQKIHSAAHVTAVSNVH